MVYFDRQGYEAYREASRPMIFVVMIRFWRKPSKQGTVCILARHMIKWFGPFGIGLAYLSLQEAASFGIVQCT
jgi:hypothetical protein